MGSCLANHSRDLETMAGHLKVCFLGGLSSRKRFKNDVDLELEGIQSLFVTIRTSTGAEIHSRGPLHNPSQTCAWGS